MADEYRMHAIALALDIQYRCDVAYEHLRDGNALEVAEQIATIYSKARQAQEILNEAADVTVSAYEME